MTPDPIGSSSVEMRSRRAYEWGLARDGLVRALIVVGLSVLAASVTRVTLQPFPLALIVLTWTFLGWRRGWWLRGARVGLPGGLATLLLPLSLLRPGCSWAMSVCQSGCARPGICALAGLALGALLAALLPRGGDRAQRATAGCGMLMGAISIGSVRYSGLFAGEALGILVGLVGGVVAATAGAWLWTRGRVATRP